ncbi:hypothetical protein EON80_18900 [bacterium]|nr:MAG: hypothetical protein EON80_18900 [bacterium]
MNLEILDTLWHSRHQNADFTDLNRLLDALYRETTDLDHRYQIDWRRARSSHFTAQRELAAGNKRAAHREFERGSDFAQWTLSLDAAEGRYWWTVNFIEAGRTATKWAEYWALRGAKNQLEQIIQMDETLDFGGPLRALGRVAHLAPPRIGGGLVAAKTYYERALDIADNSTTRLYLAGLLEDMGDKSAARAQIESIINAPTDEERVWEQQQDREKALEWLKVSGS